MKIKTENLTGRALDYAVAICDGWSADYLDKNLDVMPKYSAEWSECGQLIEKYITALALHTKREYWIAGSGGYGTSWGETVQITVCREVVRKHIGDEVEIPDELQR
ncbi:MULTISPECIES: DUF2591 family protein [Photorhabdus]|uniref:DUF2591 family protein n=1 Tax=Photorhabdus TaxID=29487 RepID=UPI000DCEB1A6|nr:MULTISPECIES: DUF2591 family protein [Photorhabdus]MCT8345145.1 DUF2591 family protein [Photorhabdus kleinii]RAW92438.1 DUF2591 domain-containing protein [Photorhabdus sp. S10-54]RAW92477.1 DUF2591 domain-containing protein [Photorhabdus sp. S9-53]RAW96046.1 DUF2591 domain-containing protein [Photorhabdus sp. S8-52]